MSATPDRADVLRRIASQRALPVVRAPDVGDAVATARACGCGGLGVIELTRSTPDVESALRALTDDDLLLGVGTVTSVAEIRSAAAAGARFVVSFACPDGFVETAHELGLVAIPGALTASEVLRCAQRGADAVKIFPARLAEPAYLRDLRAVMPELELMVTGGLRATAASIGPWLEAGALAVGLGGDLGTAGADGAQAVERRARAMVDVVTGLARP